MSQDPVDLVVPVRGAAAALARLLDSLAERPAGHPFRLHLALDGPQDPETSALVVAAKQRFETLEIHAQESRRGFAAAINLASAACRADRVWLNSDVELASGWLGGLRAAAHCGGDVATATPLTNHGTIASVPRWLEENALPAGFDLPRFAALVREVSARAYPTLPCGVGFCLYVRGEAIAALGGLDESAFGVGYGEEVDWCLRASAEGWRHVLDDATFVYHQGGASFGPVKTRLEARAERRLERRHRGWRRRLGAFLVADPIRPVRSRILAALAPRSVPADRRAPASVLHVVHGWPPWSRAGTETYAARLARWQAVKRDVAVLARYAPTDRPHGAALELVDRGVRVRLLANRFDQRDPLSRNALVDRRWERELDSLQREARPELVHIHHLAGHALSLPRAVARRGLPIVWQLQDWWLLCARANLLDRERALCSGPTPGKCARCLPLTALPPASVWSRALYRLRRRLARRALARASAIVAGSERVVEDHRSAGWLPARASVHVLDYGVERSPRDRPPRPARAPGAPIQLGFVGSVLPHKGLTLLLRVLATQPEGRFRLRLWAAPGPELERALAAHPGVAVEARAPFANEERERELAALDLLVAPSLGLESYGLAVAEALAAGTPALVSDRGALAERVARGGGGVFAGGDERTLAAELDALAADPDRIRRWRESIPPARRFEEHAEEIEEIYRRVLEGAAS